MIKFSENFWLSDRWKCLLKQATEICWAIMGIPSVGTSETARSSICWDSVSLKSHQPVAATLITPTYLALCSVSLSLSLFLKDLIYLFLERWEGRETGRETSTCKQVWLVASHPPPTRGLACNPGVCPDWESGNPTGDLSLCGMTLNPLSHTCQGPTFSFLDLNFWHHILKHNPASNHQGIEVALNLTSFESFHFLTGSQYLSMLVFTPLPLSEAGTPAPPNKPKNSTCWMSN